MSDNDEVGYGKPPRAHQFKKGQPSANPQGRPKGSTNRGLIELLNKKVQVGVKNGRRVMKPMGEVIDHNLAKKAAEGDRFAIQIIHRRLADIEKASAPPRLSAKERALMHEHPVSVEQARAELIEFFGETVIIAEEARKLGLIEDVDGVPRFAEWVIAAAGERERER